MKERKIFVKAGEGEGPWEEDRGRGIIDFRRKAGYPCGSATERQQWKRKERGRKDGGEKGKGRRPSFECCDPARVLHPSLLFCCSVELLWKKAHWVRRHFLPPFYRLLGGDSPRSPLRLNWSRRWSLAPCSTRGPAVFMEDGRKIEWDF